MRRRAMFVGACLAAAAFVVVGIAVLVALRNADLLARAETIKVGMTRAEVEATLGPPRVTEQSGDGPPRQAHWVGERCGVRVYFDYKGRVESIHKYDGRAFLPRIRSWLTF